MLGKITEATGYSGTDTDKDIAAIAQSFPFVLDLMAQEGITVRNPISYPVTLPSGRKTFTWGPGGDIDTEIPRELYNWYVVRSDEATYLGGGVLRWPEWQALQSSVSTGSEPLALYWDRTPDDDNGRTTVHVWPTLDAQARLLLYADVPNAKFALSQTVFFAPGEAMLFVLRAWEYNAPTFGVALPADFYSRVRRAEDAIVAATPPPLNPGNTRYLYGMGAIRRENIGDW